MPTDDRPLRDMLREVESESKRLYQERGEPAIGYLAAAERLARELRALAPLLRYLAHEEEPSTEALDRATFLADELEAK